MEDLHFSFDGTRFNNSNDTWIIEVGFTRPWDKARPNPLLSVGNGLLSQDRRTIKKVVISDTDGKVISYDD